MKFDFKRFLPGVLLVSATAIAAPPAAGSIALDDVRIIDPVAGQIGPPACIRLDGHRIEYIGKSGSTRCRRDALRRDLHGRVVMPGLIDMHAHLTLGPLEVRRDGERPVLQALPDDAIAEHNANRLVAFGITTVRNPGGDLAAAARYQRRLEAGGLVGPESFDAGPLLNDADLPGLAIAVTDVAAVRAAVAAQVAAGADWIKLYTALSPELLRAGIDAAHANGRPAVAHLDRIAWPDALAMGLDGIVHLMPTSPDLLEPAERSAWLATARPAAFAFFEWWEHFDPDGAGADRTIDAFNRYRPVFDATLVTFHALFLQDGENEYKADAQRYAHPRHLASWQGWFTFAIGWNPQDFVRARAIWPKVQRFAQRVYGTQARLTLGTDLGNPWIAPGISLHREMQRLHEAGVPMARVLAAATINAADALGAADRLGRVAVGFEADLVILDADPLFDVTHTLGIHAVVIDGEYLGPQALARLKGE
jgi:imidazolonepropionase-like amidohydrolase